YVHRIGRTGRAGLSGRAFTLATPEDNVYLAAITRLIGKEIPRVTVEGIAGADLEEVSARPPRRRRGRGARAGTAARPETPATAESREEPGRGTMAGTAARPETPATAESREEPGRGRKRRRRRKRGRDRRTGDRRETAQPAPARDSGNGGRKPDKPAPAGRDERPARKPDQPAPAGRDQRPARKPDQPTAQRREQPEGRKPDKPVLGLGDHTPAFLLRPSKPGRKR
ncbi:MAG: hypothetical protein O6829_02345, partial [Alphaproteobacteria bacterium]|nr:hypothetical protein [Alphaproteobacteria bacterium]